MNAVKKLPVWLATTGLLFILLFASNTLKAQHTDKSIWFLMINTGPYIYPTSSPVTLLSAQTASLAEVSGVLSLAQQTVTITFHVYLGAVPFRIVNADTKAVVATYQTNVPAGGTYVIDISELPAGNYEIAYYVPGKAPKAGTFEIPEGEE